MPGQESLLAFIAAALVVLLIPGPGVLYIVTRSLTQGHAAGFISVLGLSVGALVQVAAAVVGLSAVLLTSAAAFGVVKLLGAAYLIYLGVRTLLAPPASSTDDVFGQTSLRRVFTDGVVVSVLNPKIAIFFLAFLPQFIDPASHSPAQQVLFLGLLYVMLALITDGAYALLAGTLRPMLAGVMRGRAPRYASGIVYIGLGVSTALSDRRQ